MHVSRFASLVPLLLLFAAIYLSACPSAKQSKTVSAGRDAGPLAKHGAGLAAGSPVNPALALDFIRNALAQPVDDEQAPLGPVWNTLARLADTPQAAVLSPLQAEISSQAQEAGATTPAPLAGAWLAVDSDAALAFLRAKFAEQQYTYIQSLGSAPRLLRQELDRLDLSMLPFDCAILSLELLRSAGIEPGDAGLLKELAHHGEAQIRLRAIGYLKAMDQCTSTQEHELLDALDSTEQAVYAAALEGVKCSQAEEYANALVPLVANAVMGSEDADAPKDQRVLFASYALAYLPGDQAALMRSNLLGARDPQVRWQARFGELLHGEPSYWNDAVDVMGISDKDLWVSLQPPEALAPGLLGTYRQAAGAEDSTVRLTAAQHLARYTGDNGSVTAIELLAQLAVDDHPQVVAAALNSAAQLQARELAPLAQSALANERMPWETRLAAAGLMLAVAQPAPAAEE